MVRGLFGEIELAPFWGCQLFFFEKNFESVSLSVFGEGEKTQSETHFFF